MFNEKLGWRGETDLPEHNANEMANDASIYINLIFNGAKRKRTFYWISFFKLPGMTHVAFIVTDLDDLIACLDHEGIPFSGGPSIFSGLRHVRRRLAIITASILPLSKLFAKHIVIIWPSPQCA
ncbi:MAG: hypothetical protein AAGA73_00255 [Pseudomonadota bacterium]